jgi:hypothetical protein
LIRLTVLNTDHAPLAAIASPLSKCLMGECMPVSYRRISHLRAFLGCLGAMRPELANGDAEKPTAGRRDAGENPGKPFFCPDQKEAVLDVSRVPGAPAPRR